jgi:endogenous inhibitor of DNA gyrase (YacG/DUF329 family)
MRKILCPRCGADTIFSPENPFRPFCSERCRLIDLGDWASESYRVVSNDPSSTQELIEALENHQPQDLLQKSSRRDSEDVE